MQLTSPRALLEPAEFADVTATVMDNNPGMTQDIAGRIVTEALAFVATAAQHPGSPIAPSRVVDEGWHALLLHTAMYARPCARLEAFVHHYPERPNAARQDVKVTARTVALIKEAGHTPDLELWTTPMDTGIPVAAPCGHAPKCGPIEPIPRPPSGVAALVSP
ncbi:glycine-rich domain-containing protein [Actinacidiphila paucisporea]|uniref:Uncharacterized protein n=1 Tax=Actinacidiphila paucisporea TaxID=310782 RepID=A0A1M7BU79_9ACTN|nr:hypothetical protein [Actinacidiphila paucisporea]SHL58588.1 hypothetical protein SAMN05216499_10548 [Actinacidiphila paucisporea]